MTKLLRPLYRLLYSNNMHHNRTHATLLLIHRTLTLHPWNQYKASEAFNYIVIYIKASEALYSYLYKGLRSFVLLAIYVHSPNYRWLSVIGAIRNNLNSSYAVCFTFVSQMSTRMGNSRSISNPKTHGKKDTLG